MLAFSILFFGIFSRLVFHLPNFTPVIALALFGGCYLSRRQALLIPLLLMVVTDVVIGWHETVLLTWGSVVLVSGLGLWLRSRQTWANRLGAGLLGALVFFVITNFGAWLVMYPRTGAGFVDCYIAAIPFFRNMVFSTLFYTVFLFTCYEAVASRLRGRNWAQGLLSAE